MMDICRPGDSIRAVPIWRPPCTKIATGAGEQPEIHSIGRWTWGPSKDINRDRRETKVHLTRKQLGQPSQKNPSTEKKEPVPTQAPANDQAGKQRKQSAGGSAAQRGAAVTIPQESIRAMARIPLFITGGGDSKRDWITRGPCKEKSRLPDAKGAAPKGQLTSLEKSFPEPPDGRAEAGTGSEQWQTAEPKVGQTKMGSAADPSQLEKVARGRGGKAECPPSRKPQRAGEPTGREEPWTAGNNIAAAKGRPLAQFLVWNTKDTWLRGDRWELSPELPGIGNGCDKGTPAMAVCFHNDIDPRGVLRQQNQVGVILGDPRNRNPTPRIMEAKVTVKSIVKSAPAAACRRVSPDGSNSGPPEYEADACGDRKVNSPDGAMRECDNQVSRAPAHFLDTEVVQGTRMEKCRSKEETAKQTRCNFSTPIWVAGACQSIELSGSRGSGQSPSLLGTCEGTKEDNINLCAVGEINQIGLSGWGPPREETHTYGLLRQIWSGNHALSGTNQTSKGEKPGPAAINGDGRTALNVQGHSGETVWGNRGDCDLGAPPGQGRSDGPKARSGEYLPVR
ncbi:unnamed protein product [Symbiodinium sp. CCMP2592]|nr:unnamed protein product [Symbiodinium sp. CCMP2592]